MLLHLTKNFNLNKKKKKDFLCHFNRVWLGRNFVSQNLKKSNHFNPRISSYKVNVIQIIYMLPNVFVFDYYQNKITFSVNFIKNYYLPKWIISLFLQPVISSKELTVRRIYLKFTKKSRIPNLLQQHHSHKQHRLK